MTTFLDEAVGRSHRPDPVLPTTGGPAGNARLTAWTGAVLFVLLAVEGVTILDVHGLLTWHFVVGLLLVPPALLKTATTGWRIVRYYTGSAAYRVAGPPPVVLRLLGPLVIVSTLGVLGTGVLLELLGPDTSRERLLTTPGPPLTWLALHKAAFVVWFLVTVPHVLGRLVPALRLIRPPAIPGRSLRGLVLGLTVAGAVAGTVLLLGIAPVWR